MFGNLLEEGCDDIFEFGVLNQQQKKKSFRIRKKKAERAKQERAREREWEKLILP